MKGLDALNAHYLAMPPVAAMQVRAVFHGDDVLGLTAPLAANVNDKGCAFGGSMAGIMTLAGWGLLTLKLEAEALPAEVYVADSHVRYLKPLYGDLDAQARFEPGVDWAAFMRSLRERGRARAGILATLHDPEGVVVAELSGRFAALRPV
ncbi:MAG: thioesterase domain-containing protein [Arenimonas sp.]|uniref:YiiD C-terminal domain-containing protein n=1 Tax=Arenimonas sp. TaxID=1872635 RepID=UPI0025C4DD14|nr:YiiD C-terminal domain-containing protein [Arenimonas sp.]MBW8366515.1 thioesterase domain-containing protein [Arenimonas sp.]